MNVPKIKTKLSGEIRQKKQKIKLATAEYRKEVPKTTPKHGWKRAIGIGLGTAGTALIAGGQVLIGAALAGIGGIVGALGILHGKKKRRANEDQSDNVWAALTQWLYASYRLAKCLTKGDQDGH